MSRRLALVATVLWLLIGCGGGAGARRSTPGFPPYPGSPALQPASPLFAGPVVTTTMGRLGDHWLENIQLRRVGRAQRAGELGYEVTYDAPGGGTFTLFWPRDQIDFDDARPGRYFLHALPSGNERILYPDRLTSQSLPQVFRAILEIERAYGREADGAIAAARAFGDIAALGATGPPLRMPGQAAAAPIPRAQAIVAGASAAKKFKPFTSANFRYNLGQLTGGIPKDVHAHHVFPQKLAGKFRKVGINIHDPRYGAWWQAAAHRQNAAAYNAAWDEFLDPSKTAEQILRFGRLIASKHGLHIYF